MDSSPWVILGVSQKETCPKSQPLPVLVRKVGIAYIMRAKVIPCCPLGQFLIGSDHFQGVPG